MEQVPCKFCYFPVHNARVPILFSRLRKHTIVLNPLCICLFVSRYVVLARNLRFQIIVQYLMYEVTHF
jgi:hypothetical protein